MSECAGCGGDRGEVEPATKACVGWRAWYADGSDHASTDTSWEDLPGDGVVVVMLYFADGTRRIMCGSEWYFRTGEGAFDEAQSIEYAPELMQGVPVPEAIRVRYPGASAKRGKVVPDDEYMRIHSRAFVAKTLE